MKLIKQLHEMAGEFKNDELSVFKCHFYEAIDDGDLLNLENGIEGDYEAVCEVIDANFKITQEGSTFLISQFEDPYIEIDYHQMLKLSAGYDFKLLHIEVFNLNIRMTTKFKKELIPDNIGALKMRIRDVDELQYLKFCSVELSISVICEDTNPIDMTKIPLHLFHDITLFIGAYSTKDLPLVNLEPMLKRIITNNICLKLYTDKDGDIASILQQLHQDKNINKAIDSIIDTGLEDLL